MVFENLTLFEIDLNGARIGPRVITGDDEHTDEMVSDESSGRGRFLPVLIVLAMAVGGAMLYRRSRSTDFEFENEADEAESDLAEAQ